MPPPHLPGSPPAPASTRRPVALPPLAAPVLAALLAASLPGCAGEGRTLVAVPLAAGPASPAAAFDAPGGWVVTLQEAWVTFADLQLEAPPSVTATSPRGVRRALAALSPLGTAHAHPGHDFAGSVSGEWLGTATVDLLGGDFDADGEVTMRELSQVQVAPTGYDVGQYAEVTDLGAFVAFLTRTLGHIDGEGHCQVDL
ncbi:hypothetical protein L6R50_12280 [Myxococcota bacterium]|nr:hypothetical protein [Myxococcota bacterium]